MDAITCSKGGCQKLTRPGYKTCDSCLAYYQRKKLGKINVVSQKLNHVSVQKLEAEQLKEAILPPVWLKIS